MPSYEGLTNINLKHSHHRTFHAAIIPAEKDLDFTRFYCWHIDAASCGSLRPRITSLLAVKELSGRTQSLLYDDVSNDKFTVPLGTTAFVSGYTMFDLLIPAQQEFVRNAMVECAPHP